MKEIKVLFFLYVFVNNERRSIPIAIPMAGRSFPPSCLHRSSYLPPPKYASCAPRSEETASKTKPV